MNGLIYVVECDNAVKIGWTAASVGKRISSLQNASYRPIVLIGIIKGTRADEAALHTEFKDLNIRGEWFTKGLKIAEFIKTLSPAKHPQPRPKCQLVRGEAFTTIHMRVEPSILSWLNAEWHRRGLQTRVDAVRAILQEAKGRR
jgi:hypothetical protein